MLFAGTLFALVVLAAVDAGLRTTAAPAGVISFEFAGDAAGARSILASWRQAEVLHLAGFSLGFDYLYLVLYSTTIAAACAGLAVGARRRGLDRLGVAGAAIAWLQWVAAAFDGVENAALLRILEGEDAALWAPLAAAAAYAKFALIALGLGYVLAAGVLRAVRRPAS